MLQNIEEFGQIDVSGVFFNGAELNAFVYNLGLNTL